MKAAQKSLLTHFFVITVFILITFGNSLNHDFAWDDNLIIVQNQLLNSILNIPKFFILEDIADGPTGYYRPITYVSFALDRALWGLNPVGFNITNLVLHILVALLFYQVILTLFKRDNLAFVAALLFSLHPIVGETVNFHAGGRNTLLSACFALLTLLFYMKRKPLPATFCYTLAIFSKEFALLLPAVFLLYDRTMVDKKFRYQEYLPYLISTIGYLGLRSFAVQSGNLLTTINLTENFWIVPQTIVSYLKIMVFPLEVKSMYDVNNQITWSSFIFNSTVLAALVGIAIALRKKLEVLFAIAMFLIFLLPVTNLFPLGTAMMADRYAYFSLFGFSLGLAYSICLARREAVIVITIFLCCFFINIDIKRNDIWKNDLSLFSRMIKDAPEMSVGFLNLGYAYYSKQDYANAEKYLIVAHNKKDLNTQGLIFNALTLLELDKPEKALAALNKAIEIEPGSPVPYVMANRINEEVGNEVLATQYRKKAAELFPGIFESMQQKAYSAFIQGEEQMARQNLLRAERFYYWALGYDPLFVPALVGMGSLAASKGELVKSLHYFTKAAALNPLDPTVHLNLSMAYEALGKKVEAQKELARSKELTALRQQTGEKSQH